MNFLYDNNGRGIFSSLAGSWVFWIIIVLVVVLIFVIILRSNKDLQKTLHIENLFQDNVVDGNTTAKPSNRVSLRKQDQRDPIRQSLINEINTNNDHMMEMYDGVAPNMEKYLDTNLEADLLQNVKILGKIDEEKNVNSYYAIDSKKDNVFKISESDRSEVNFKLELHDISKLIIDSKSVNYLKIYNKDLKCIALFTLDLQKIVIRSSSPFIDDVYLHLDNVKRLLVFKQVSNKLYVDKKQVAAFDIYDKITYFNVKGSIIKELQYM